MGQLRITQVKSSVSRHSDQGRTLRALGITKMHASVVHEDKPEIMGMVGKVAHLVKVEPADGLAPGDRKRRGQ